MEIEDLLDYKEKMERMERQVFNNNSKYVAIVKLRCARNEWSSRSARTVIEYFYNFLYTFLRDGEDGDPGPDAQPTPFIPGLPGPAGEVGEIGPSGPRGK